MEASRDQNHIGAKFAVLNTDTVQGQHLVQIGFNSVTKKILVSTTATISFTMVPVEEHDENYLKVWMFQGDTDGLLYPAVATADGELLIDSN